MCAVGGLCVHPRQARDQRLDAPANIIQFVFADFAAESIPVYSEDFGGAALVSLSAFQHPLDELLFKFSDSFFEKDATFDHQSNQGFQLISQIRTLRGAHCPAPTFADLFPVTPHFWNERHKISFRRFCMRQNRPVAALQYVEPRKRDLPAFS